MNIILTTGSIVNLKVVSDQGSVEMEHLRSTGVAFIVCLFFHRIKRKRLLERCGGSSP